MTTEKPSTARLFRRPRKPKMERIELREPRESEVYDEPDSDEYDTDSEEDMFRNPNRAGGQQKDVKLPPINSLLQQYTREQLISIVEETTITNDSSASYDNLRLFPMNTNPTNSPVSPQIARLYNSPAAIANANRSSLAKSHLSEAVFAQQRKSLMRPYKPLGPDPLPARAPKLSINEIRARRAFYESLSVNEQIDAANDNDYFDFNDFLLDNGYHQRLVASCVKSISKYNYRQVCRMLERQIREERNKNSEQDRVHVQTLQPDIEPVLRRKPMRQAMIEMANFVKNELAKKTGAHLKTKFNPLPKWQRMKDGSYSELVVYEDQDAPNKAELEQIEETSDQEITPAHIAVVDCLLRNGLVLSFKAYAIDSLPDMSSLQRTLIYINLSYNHFMEFPKELFDFTQLEVIKMRNNPLRYLPDSFGLLRNLTTLVFSYCQLKELSRSIYDLENLNHLDVSYNRLTNVDEEIVRLRKLKTLNYDGNELEYLPCNMLSMKNLERIYVRNNYMHPLIWRKYNNRNVQRLEDLAAAKFCQLYDEESDEFHNLDYKIKKLIKGTTARCDCCGSKRFGDGVPIVRACARIFNVNYLPFLFNVCSRDCFDSFMRSE